MRGSQRLNRQLECHHGTDLGSLHVCYSCETWSSYGTPHSGSRGSFWLCYLLLKPFPPTELPCLALLGEEVSSLTVTWYAMTDWYIEGLFFFIWRERTNGWEEKNEVGSRDWEERREGVETVIGLENKLTKQSQTKQKVHRGLLKRNIFNLLLITYIVARIKTKHWK